MKKHLKPILSLLFLTILLVVPFFVFAEDPSTSPPTASTNTSLGMLEAVATGEGGYRESSLPVIIGTVIRAAFSLLGGIFIILMILAGYEWMTAEGNEQKVDKAKNYIKRAIIGLIITLSSWAIWTFILEQFILG